MTWEYYNVEEQKKQLVTDYDTNKETMSYLCKKFGISRTTGHKWFKRYKKKGLEGLKNLSKAPKSPNRIYTESQINLSIELKCQHITWGPKKITAYLKTKYPDKKWPSQTRLYEIFKGHHLVTSRKLRRRVPLTAPLGDLKNCNDTWTIDFKGWFLTGDGKKVGPLTVMDAHSRYLLKCVHLEHDDFNHVWPILEALFVEYGLPKRIRTDNGPPFGSRSAGRLTQLSKNLLKIGVLPEWITPGCPQENGRHERFHLTLKQDIITPPKKTLAEQLAAFISYSEEYNFDRPHEALDFKTPASCYTPSTRKWNGTFQSPEYDEREYQIRKIGQSGSIWYKGKEYFISGVLVGDNIGLKLLENSNYAVFYGPIHLGELDLTKGFIRPTILGNRKKFKK